jgi:hypothetical protein
MKLHELSLIKSERGLRSALSSLFFGAKGALLASAANFESIERTVGNLRKAGYADRAEAIESGNRYQKLQDSAHAAAQKAMSLHSYADSRGAVFEADFSPEIQRGKDLKQLQAASEAAGIDIEVLKQKEANAIKRKYDQHAQAQCFAEGLFWSADFNEDIEIKAETVLNALSRQRDYLLEWSVLDLAELVVLKHDINAMVAYIEVEENRGEPTEGSHDDPHTDATMSAMNSAYQAGIEAQQPKDIQEDKLKRNLKRIKKEALAA